MGDISLGCKDISVKIRVCGKDSIPSINQQNFALI